MENKLKLIIGIPPSVNHYLGYRAVTKGKKTIVVAYTTKETKDYKSITKKTIIDQIKEQNYISKYESGKFFRADVTFFFDRVDMDGNNYYKVPWDIITETKLVWEDDNIVLENCKAIYYDSKNPRMEIEIYLDNRVGIFNDVEEYNIFLNKCSTCSRFKKSRCSIFQRVINSKITEDVVDKKCLKFSLTKS